MRILVATTAGAGHFAALVPFAAAYRDAGHAVRVAAPESFAAAVGRARLEAVPLADAPPEELGAAFAQLPGASREEANAIIMRDVFGRIDARAALPGMQAAVDAWHPDVIVREEMEFASYLVAEFNHIPHAAVAISVASLEEIWLPLVDEPLRELGSLHGVAGLLAAPRLSLVPASLEDDDTADSRPTHRYRYPAPPNTMAAPPQEWWPQVETPLVYMTFGSVAASVGFFPHVYRAMLDALADLPARVLLTLGAAGDPARLAPLPPNVHVERWWPQEQVMPHAAAMLTHGGFGTTLSGLSAGVPMVVIPLFADDQYANARRIQAVGAGIALQDGPAAASRVRGALEDILNHDAYRVAARRMANDIGSLPHPSESLAVLESL